MSIPVIQGAIRYAYKLAGTGSSAKSAGEGYAFMMSIVHRVHACTPADATYIYKALDIPSEAPFLTSFTLQNKATFSGVKKAFEDNYKCMGITCADVGGLFDNNDNAYMIGAEPCNDPVVTVDKSSTSTATETETLPTWAVIALAGAGFLMIIFFGLMCAYKSSKDMTIKMYNDLKKEGAVGKV